MFCIYTVLSYICFEQYSFALKNMFWGVVIFFIALVKKLFYSLHLNFSRINLCPSAYVLYMFMQGTPYMQTVNVCVLVLLVKTMMLQKLKCICGDTNVGLLLQTKKKNSFHLFMFYFNVFSWNCHFLNLKSFSYFKNTYLLILCDNDCHFE